MKGRRYSPDAEVFAVAETWLDRQLSEFVLSDLQKLEQRTRKCIELRGEYVEYILRLVAVACLLPGRAKDLSVPPRKMIREIRTTLATSLHHRLHAVGPIPRNTARYP